MLNGPEMSNCFLLPFVVYNIWYYILVEINIYDESHKYKTNHNKLIITKIMRYSI